MDYPQKELHDRRRRAMRVRKKIRKGLLDPNSREFNEHRFVQLRNILQNGKQRGRPEIPEDVEISTGYDVASHSSYDKCVDHVVDALDINVTDAEYAVKKIGVSYELIFLAYSMHINTSLRFRNAIDIVSRCRFTPNDTEKYQDARELAKSKRMKIGEAIELLALTGYEPDEQTSLKPGITQNTQYGTNLGQLLGPIFPTTFSDLSEKEREELTHKLYGDNCEGDIGRILEQSLDQDM